MTQEIKSFDEQIAELTALQAEIKEHRKQLWAKIRADRDAKKEAKKEARRLGDARHSTFIKVVDSLLRANDTAASDLIEALQNERHITAKGGAEATIIFYLDDENNLKYKASLKALKDPNAGDVNA